MGTTLINKQIIEIEVKMPDGYRYTRFGIPQLGELYLVDGQVRERRCDASIGMECVIVEKDWVWPRWLKAGWIAMEPSGNWFAWNTKPTLQNLLDGANEPAEYSWIGAFGMYLDPDIVDFTPPPCGPDDAHKSLRANPAYRNPL
jgi:hypothetical protein